MINILVTPTRRFLGGFLDIARQEDSASLASSPHLGKGCLSLEARGDGRKGSGWYFVLVQLVKRVCSAPPWTPFHPRKPTFKGDNAHRACPRTTGTREKGENHRFLVPHIFALIFCALALPRIIVFAFAFAFPSWIFTDRATEDASSEAFTIEARPLHCPLLTESGIWVHRWGVRSNPPRTAGFQAVDIVLVFRLGRMKWFFGSCQDLLLFSFWYSPFIPLPLESTAIYPEIGTCKAPTDLYMRD